MPNGGLVVGWRFSDFTFAGDGGLLNPTQNWSNTTNIPVGATATLDANATQVALLIDDDDMTFDDGFQDFPPGSGGANTLNQEIRPGSGLGDPGDVAEVEFTLFAVDSQGNEIEFLFTAIGPGENQGDLLFVATSAPLIPGETYTFIGDADGGGTPYQDLVCFVRGTRIAVPGGAEPIETLKPGDEVRRADGGRATVLWAGARWLTVDELADRALWPVRIAAGALGEGLPRRDLLVSRQHRLRIRSWRSGLLFDSCEALVPAVSLVDGDGIRLERPEGSLCYHHILCAAHEVVLAEGVAAESLYLGAEAGTALSAAGWAEVSRLFPGLRRFTMAPAAPLLRTAEGRALARVA